MFVKLLGEVFPRQLIFRSGRLHSLSRPTGGGGEGDLIRHKQSIETLHARKPLLQACFHASSCHMFAEHPFSPCATKQLNRMVRLMISSLRRFVCPSSLRRSSRNLARKDVARPTLSWHASITAELETQIWGIELLDAKWIQKGDDLLLLISCQYKSRSMSKQCAQVVD